MPDLDLIQPNFEQALETDIEQLTAEVKMHQEKPELQGASGQEVIKRSIQAMTQTAPPTPSASSGQASGDVFQNPLPAYAQSAPAETKLEIEHLLEMAFREGIMKATTEATKSNPFVLDTFHDALAGKLYPELKKRGIVD